MIVAIALAALLDFSANWLAAHALVSAGPFLIIVGAYLIVARSLLAHARSIVR
jgi:hypothetical protein